MSNPSKKHGVNPPNFKVAKNCWKQDTSHGSQVICKMLRGEGFMGGGVYTAPYTIFFDF